MSRLPPPSSIFRLPQLLSGGSHIAKFERLVSPDVEQFVAGRPAVLVVWCAKDRGIASRPRRAEAT